MAWSSAPPADKSSADKSSGDKAPGDKAPADGKDRGKGKDDDDDQPDLPTALPEGAVVPEAVTVPPVRADVFAGRATALGRMAQCPKCSGSGVKVTRHRESQGHMKNPKITETTSDCPDCHGIGICPNPGRVGPVLDSPRSAMSADGVSSGSWVWRKTPALRLCRSPAAAATPIAAAMAAPAVTSALIAESRPVAP
jgi:hypothetical protein